MKTTEIFTPLNSLQILDCSESQLEYLCISFFFYFHGLHLFVRDAVLSALAFPVPCGGGDENPFWQRHASADILVFAAI